MLFDAMCAPASTGALVPNERTTRKLLCTAEPLQQNDGGGAPRARGVGPAHTSTPEQSKAKQREREREITVAILAQVLHLCLGVCDTPLHRGGGWLVD